MTKTFAEVLAQYKESSPHKFIPGRKAMHSMENILNKGYELMMQVSKKQTNGGSNVSDHVGKPDFDDVVIELF